MELRPSASVILQVLAEAITLRREVFILARLVVLTPLAAQTITSYLAIKLVQISRVVRTISSLERQVPRKRLPISLQALRTFSLAITSPSRAELPPVNSILAIFSMVRG